jgi:hypothetical protein
VEDFAHALWTRFAHPIEDGHVHVHEGELHLDAARAPDDLTNVGEPLQGVEQVVEDVVVGPVRRHLHVDESIDIEPVIFGAADDRRSDGHRFLRVDQARAAHKMRPQGTRTVAPGVASACGTGSPRPRGRDR